MKKSFKLGKKYIKEFSTPFIIAEAGVNHNGNLDFALKMIEVAAKAGADAIKFQTFKAEQVVTEKGKMAEYQIKNMKLKMTQREMLKKLELDEKFYKPIIDECKKKNIMFLSTPHGGVESVNFLEKINVSAYKVGSGDLTNYILLEKLARIGKPIIIGTGMSTLKEIKNAVRFINSYGNEKIVALHCTTNYPCPLDQVNLLSMTTMMRELNINVGYSDHTLGCQVAVMATLMGAAVYECHFSLNNKLSGPDHLASSNPDELEQKIRMIRNVSIILGYKDKKPTKYEKKKMIKTVRKSIVAARDIKKGEIINRDSIEAKRPGDGISPEFFKEIVGRKTRNFLKVDQQIKYKDLI